jgi:pimeloyl-ACP methyl ester carboxylesterase
METSFGQLEYATAGHGPPVLMIHGTGGGFDQGLIFTEGLLPYGHQVIAPSRFGYLRSDFPADPSSEHQADAFVELLDRLRIRQLAVAGGSAGALSAVQFALRHPDRTAALILIVPAANVRGTDPVKMSALQEFLVRRLATSDFLFWAGIRAARDQMIGTLLATDPTLVRQAVPDEQRRAERILEAILPVARRSKGMLNDARLAGNPARVDFSKLSVPTLVISVADDRFGTAATARDIAAAVPDSRLVLYPRGGHIWIGHDSELWREVARFLAGIREAQPVTRGS